MEAELNELRYCHFGVLSPAATRRAVRLHTGLCDVVVVDIRKMNALNAVLGWSRANSFVGELVRHRVADIAGQWGGDEFVFVVPAGDGAGLLSRLLKAAAELTKGLTLQERAKLEEKTAGLVNGFHLAAVLVANVTNVSVAVDRAIDATGLLKEGRNTGDRNTSGTRGTQLARMAA
jgi:hypothetical protein